METIKNILLSLKNNLKEVLQAVVVTYLLILLTIFVIDYHKNSGTGRFIAIRDYKYLDSKTGEILIQGTDAKLHKIIVELDW